ncbi:hypothetical protein FNV43_RR08572 [Rhamnella rubrinervis]|uniref:RNase H type-1 domain-containing protein n=1 Tax=Rhamnella rubrinervis TaxID=2594499 RepID=A0A8K0H8U3_9ROSA|nr:hypothetical protein FNV43_RR08572 [Rhamnella rubrinervis]
MTPAATVATGRERCPSSCPAPSEIFSPVFVSIPDYKEAEQGRIPRHGTGQSDGERGMMSAKALESYGCIAEARGFHLQQTDRTIGKLRSRFGSEGDFGREQRIFLFDTFVWLMEKAVQDFTLAVEEFKGKKADIGEGSSSNDSGSRTWKPPSQEWLKINVDAAFKFNKTAGAFIVRNAVGKVIFVSSKVLERGCNSAYEAEAFALDWATDYADKYGWKRIVFEMDAKMVMEDVLAESESNSWIMFERLSAIRRRLSKADWKIEWSPRESNRVADSVAKFFLSNGVSFSVDEFSIGELPSFVLDGIVKEQLSGAV